MESSGRVSLLEVIPVDASAELLNGAALIHDARRRILPQVVQQQGGQQQWPKVVGAQVDLQVVQKLQLGVLHKTDIWVSHGAVLR